MKKNIAISTVCHEMLLELSKQARKKPEEFIEQQIKNLYSGSK
jgi:hypothetical protein